MNVRPIEKVRPLTEDDTTAIAVSLIVLNRALNDCAPIKDAVTDHKRMLEAFAWIQVFSTVGVAPLVALHAGGFTADSVGELNNAEV